MTHYKKKREAILLIENMINKAGVIEIDTIVLAVSRTYGFGEAIVKKHIDLLDRNGEVELKGTTITSRK